MRLLATRNSNGEIVYKYKPVSNTSNRTVETQENTFTLQEKIESVMSMLNTPIFRRKIGNEEIIKLIIEICQEMRIGGGV